MNVTEFAPITEACTAVMTSHTQTGENYEGPISVGYYTGSPSEVWIESQGVRTNINADDVETFIKQLRRAVKIMREVASAE